MCSQGGAAGELTGRTSRSDDADGARDDTRPAAHRPPPVAYGGRVSSPRPTDAPPGERPDPRDANGRGGRPQPLPWQGRGERADWVIIGGVAASTPTPLLLLPLTPALVSSHPALLEALRGSTASVINMGARARIGETSLVLAVLLGVPSLMMFDWAYWWAGRRWGDAVFVWLLGGPGPKTEQRLARLHRIEARGGPGAVVFPDVLPIPPALLYPAGRGRLRVRPADPLGAHLRGGRRRRHAPRRVPRARRPRHPPVDRPARRRGIRLRAGRGRRRQRDLPLRPLGDRRDRPVRGGPGPPARALKAPPETAKAPRRSRLSEYRHGDSKRAAHSTDPALQRKIRADSRAIVVWGVPLDTARNRSGPPSTGPGLAPPRPFRSSVSSLLPCRHGGAVDLTAHRFDFDDAFIEPGIGDRERVGAPFADTPSIKALRALDRRGPCVEQVVANRRR